MFPKHLTIFLVSSLLVGQVLAEISWNKRIIGGEFITIEEAPWQVGLLFRNKHMCGGSIYSELFVITAAHCVSNTEAKDLSIRAGSSHYNREGEVLPVAAVFIHEEYNIIRYDIAILRLERRLTFSRQVQSIELATQSPRNGSVGAVSGWGLTIEGDDTSKPDILKRASVFILSQEECASGKYNLGGTKPTSEVICAIAEGNDTCQTDSGGPLVVENRLVGVTSYGDGCARPNSPGVYTSIAKLHNWILQTIVSRKN